MSQPKNLPAPLGELGSPFWSPLQRPQNPLDEFLNFDEGGSADAAIDALFDDPMSCSPKASTNAGRQNSKEKTGSGVRPNASGSDRSLSAVPDLGTWPENDDMFQFPTFDGVPLPDLQNALETTESDFMKAYPPVEFDFPVFRDIPRQTSQAQPVEVSLNDLSGLGIEMNVLPSVVNQPYSTAPMLDNANVYPDSSIPIQLGPFDMQPSFTENDFHGPSTNFGVPQTYGMNGTNTLTGMYQDPVLFSTPMQSTSAFTGNTAAFTAPIDPMMGYNMDTFTFDDINQQQPQPRTYRTSSARTSESRRQSRRQTRTRQPSDQDKSSSFSSQQSPSRVRGYRAEPPKKDEERDWVRINNTTEGKSSRTGKINRYDPKRDGKYRSTSHPLGGRWSSSHYTFNYNRYGELSKLTYSIEEMQQFIYEHPSNEHSNLVLWIQKNPADSARRYPTCDGSKCRFENCPGQSFSRSIGVGLYRVALDDQWTTHGEQRDPFHVAGYVHLYCMERFLDFADICRRFDVRADSREIAREPRGRFGPSLGHDVEFDTASDFVSRCKTGTLAGSFPAYPSHAAYARGAAKNHAGTLTCALTKVKNQQQNPSKRRMQEQRGLKASHILVHLGDLEMQVKARRAHKDARRVAATTADEADTGHQSRGRKRGAHRDDSDSDSCIVVRATKRHRGPDGESLQQGQPSQAPSATNVPLGFRPANEPPQSSNPLLLADSAAGGLSSSIEAGCRLALGLPPSSTVPSQAADSSDNTHAAPIGGRRRSSKVTGRQAASAAGVEGASGLVPYNESDEE